MAAEIGGPFMVMAEREGVTFAPLKDGSHEAALAVARDFEARGYRVWVFRASSGRLRAVGFDEIEAALRRPQAG